MKRFMSMILMAAVVVTSVVVPNSNNVETVKAAEVDAESTNKYSIAHVISGSAISAPVKTETGAYDGYETYFDWMQSKYTERFSLDMEVDVHEGCMSLRKCLVGRGYVIPEEYTMVMGMTALGSNIMLKPDGTGAIIYKADGYDGYGRDRDGYNRSGEDFWGYDREGYDYWGYDREGYNRDGYNMAGYDREGYNEYGCDKNGINKGFSEKDIVVEYEDADFNEEEITSNSNKIKWMKNFQKKIIGKDTHVYVRNRDGSQHEMKNVKLTMKKVSVNKNGYGTYNLIINSKVYGVFTTKVVVVPNDCNDICWRMFSSRKGATRGNLQISLTNPCDGTDGVQYTIGKAKNSSSTKFIKTYKKMTCKKFNKKYVHYIANFTNIKRSDNAKICVKYRTYAVLSNGKKVYSEWQYE